MPPSPEAASFRFLADENISLPLVKRLRKAGYDVALTPKGLKNGRVIALAAAQSRVLLTHDRDFADPFRYPPAKTEGIIVLAIHPPRDVIVLDSLLRFFQTLGPADLRGRLSLLTENGVTRM